MTVSRVPETIDALVAVFRAAGLTVYDGPQVEDWSQSGNTQYALFVGYDGNGEDSELRSAAETQTWASLGASHRNDEFDIICSVAALDGSNDTKAARDQVYSVLESAVAAIMADKSLGLGATPYVAEMLSGDLYTMPTNSGILCRILFVVHVKTRV